MNKKNKGFTLVETMVALVIVAISVLMLAGVLVISMQSNRHASIRMQLSQVYDGYQNRLVSQPFDSALLSQGEHGKREEPFDVNWQTQTISNTLKKINLSVSYRSQTRRKGYFYKSRLIKETR